MTDAKTLARKLAALTATETFQGKAMILCKSGQPAAMSYVLQAIDGTMLLRDVVFSVADQSLTLRISGKRVIGVLAASGDLQVPASALGQPLAADDTATLDLLGHALQRLTAQQGLVLMERREADTDVSLAGSGVGTGVLSTHWDVPLEVEKPDPMKAFATACAAHATAMFVLNGEEVETVEGQTASVEVLQAVLENDWTPFEDAHAGLTNDDPQKRLRVLDGLGPEGQAVVCAEIDEKQCFALIHTGDAMVLAQVWADGFLT